MKITDGRIIDAEVKDARNLVYYADVPQIYAVLDGNVVLETSAFTIENDTLTLKRPPFFGLRYLIAKDHVLEELLSKLQAK